MIGIKQITKKNLPFFISWIALIIWVDCFALPVGQVSEISNLSKISTTSIFALLYPLAGIIILFLFNIKKLVPFTKFSAFVAIIGVLVAGLLEGSLVSYISIILAAVGFGHIFLSANYGFFMILNNSEKLYSISLGILLSKIVLLFKSNLAFNIIGLNFFETMHILGLLPFFVCALFYPKEESNEHIKSEIKSPLSYYTVLILAFVVLFFNDFLALTLWRSIAIIAPFTLNVYHVAGVSLGIVITIVLQQFVRINICHVLNFSFATLAMGFAINVLAYSTEWFLLSTFLFGVSYGAGFISIYYIIGIIAKKSQNLTFFKIVILSFASFFIFGVLLLSLLKNVDSQFLFSITALFATAIVLLIFTLTPFFTKILYNADWTEDLHRLDVTHVNKLTARLSELMLSPKEIQVCNLLLDGYTLRQTSAILNISYSTVNTYCTSIYRKLDINSRTELLVMFNKYLIK